MLRAVVNEGKIEVHPKSRYQRLVDLHCVARD
jgi:hypothetical protein